MSDIADTISVTKSSLAVGATQYYNIKNAAANTSTHDYTLTATCGSYSVTLPTSTTSPGGRYSGTCSFDGSWLPASTSGTVTLTLITYDATSEAIIGTTTTTFTLTIPDYSITNSQINVSATYNNLKISNTYYLNGISSVTLTATYTPISNYSLTPYIKFCVWTASGLIWNGSVRVNSSGVATKIFSSLSASDQTIYFTCYAWDGRGKASGNTSTRSSNKAITDKYIYTYTAPVLQSVELVRCDSDGTVNPSGDYVKFTGTATVDDIDSANSGTSTAVLDSVTKGTQSITAGSAVTLTPYITSSTSSGTGSISVTDTVGNSATVNLTYASPFVIVAFSDDAIGVGKIPTANTFDVGIPVNCVNDGTNGFGDVVVAQGTSTNWVWRKWKSGLAELWYYGTVSATRAMVSYNGEYRLPLDDFPNKAVPITLSVGYICGSSAYCDDGAVGPYFSGMGNYATISGNIISPKNHGTKSWRLSIYMRGTWS